MSIHEVFSADELDAFLSKSKTQLVIVKFGAEWCRPCNELQPHVDALAAELEEGRRDVKFVKVEKTDETEELFERYEVTKLPTLILSVDNDTKNTLHRPDPDELRKQIFTLLPPPPLILDEDF